MVMDMPTRATTVPASPGVEIAVTEWPSPGNPPLLILHGIGSCAETWANVAPALAERYHLYVLDHRGHGASSRPDTGYLLPDYAADLDALIANLGIDDANLNILGHSLGALITMTWGADNPGRARRIVLEDPPLRMVPEIMEAFDGWVQLNAMPPEQVAAWYAENEPGWSPDDYERRARWITSTHPNVYQELRADSISHMDAGPDLRLANVGNIQSPLLILRGDLDAGSMTRPDDAAAFATRLPTTAIHHIPGVGHSIHRDAPGPFTAATLAFLDDR